MSHLNCRELGKGEGRTQGECLGRGRGSQGSTGTPVISLLPSPSLLESRGVAGGRAGGLTDLGQESAEVTQECHREGSKGKRRKEIFLSFFFF